MSTAVRQECLTYNSVGADGIDDQARLEWGNNPDVTTGDWIFRLSPPTGANHR